MGHGEWSRATAYGVRLGWSIGLGCYWGKGSIMELGHWERDVA